VNVLSAHIKFLFLKENDGLSIYVAEDGQHIQYSYNIPPFLGGSLNRAHLKYDERV